MFARSDSVAQSCICAGQMCSSESSRSMMLFIFRRFREPNSLEFIRNGLLTFAPP